MFITGETVGLTEWIIDDTWLVLLCSPRREKEISNFVVEKWPFHKKLCAEKRFIMAAGLGKK